LYQNIYKSNPEVVAYFRFATLNFHLTNFLGWSWPLHVPPRNSTNARNKEENAPRPLQPQNEEVLEALDHLETSYLT